jgi:hypothetical protein
MVMKITPSKNDPAVVSKQPRSTPLPKLASPAQRALAGADIQSLELLTKFSEAEIKRLHGIGPNALKQLHSALTAKGLSFADGKR